MYQNIFVDRDINTIYVWDDEDGLSTLPYSSFSYAYVPDKNGTYVSMAGKRLAKKYKAYAIQGEKYESDVPIETRVLMDMYLDSDEPSTNHNVGYIDIEVDSSTKFATPQKADNEITDITFYDSASKVYAVFSIDTSGELDGVELDGAKLFLFPDEKSMLMAFIKYYESANPTIITGWNIDGYDIPYLYNRLKRVLGESIANRLSPIGKVKYSEFKNRYEIAGRSILDYLPIYKKFTYTEQANYRLDTIARFELGEGKVSYEGTLAEFRRDDPVGFIKYNLQDVVLIVKMEARLKLIELIRGICHVGHVPYESYEHSSRYLEGTILTYLHRKKIIAPNKPADGKEKFEQQKEDDEEGFKGAFVKVPMPGRYEWVYSLDLQSLYPSVIMSLNISTETKMGMVADWDVYKFNSGEQNSFDVTLYPKTKDEVTRTMTRDNLRKFLDDSKYMISSNGILYRSDKTGIIPEILDKWFRERKEYKALMAKAEKEGNSELEQFYDRRQHIQKIFLNSVYGTLGLPIFRFYDVDNALAVTSSGQDIIKNSARFVNQVYEKKNIPPKTRGQLDIYWQHLKDDAKRRDQPTPDYPDANDHCVYVDTDSLYFSATPFFESSASEEEKLEFSIKLANGFQKLINVYYDDFAKEFFNCYEHRLVICGEAISRTAIWVAKKRYVLKRIYDLDKKKPITDPSKQIKAKGLDVVRSTFPPAFKKLMIELIEDMLNMLDKSVVDKKILEFHESMSNIELKQIARNSAVNKLSKYEDVDSTNLGHFAKGATAHVKAAISYNRLLRKLGQETHYRPIVDGDKIIYVYLTPNKYFLETIAFRGDQDCPELVKFAAEHIDYEQQFDKELKNKLESFYNALGWGNIPTELNQTVYDFFE